MAGGGARGAPDYSLPVRVLSRLFRRLFLRDLENAYDAGRLRFSGPLASLADAEAFSKRVSPNCAASIGWSMPSRRSAARAGRSAISAATLIASPSPTAGWGVEDGKVRFTWKEGTGWRHQGDDARDATEFIRRFLLHTLPDGFHRIRHYGFLANGDRSDNLARCRRLIDLDAATTPDQPHAVVDPPASDQAPIQTPDPPAAPTAAASCAASPSCRARRARELTPSSATPHDRAANLVPSYHHRQYWRRRAARSRHAPPPPSLHAPMMIAAPLPLIDTVYRPALPAIRSAAARRSIRRRHRRRRAGTRRQPTATDHAFPIALNTSRLRSIRLQ